MKLHTMEVQLWDRDKQIWTRDIDRSIDDATLQRFAAICGTPIERARQTCLASYEGIVFRELNRKGHSSWILPAGVYHRKRRLPGMQFCPYCLATDEDPYFRKAWRLAFSTICENHGCMLYDCCPECKSPVVFHRQELGQRWHWQVDSLSLCTNCGFDLKYAAVFEAPVAEIHAWLAFRSQLSFFELGWTFAGDKTFHYSHLYFDALRNLLRKLRSKMAVHGLREAAERELGIAVEWTSDPDTPFEHCGLVERHCLLQIAVWLLMDWPARFLRVARAAGIRFSELMREFDDDPFWFRRGADVLEFKPVGPCAAERETMRNLLLQAVDDQIRLDVLKRHARSRIAEHSLRELWLVDGLPFPDDVAHGAASVAGQCVRFSRPQRHALPDAKLDRDDELQITVVATVSSKQNGTYGLRVCAASREALQKWFPRKWNEVEVEMDGQTRIFRLRSGFWEKAPELRSSSIRPWLEMRGLATWPHGQPPGFKLVKLRGRRFRLLG